MSRWLAIALLLAGGCKDSGTKGDSEASSATQTRSESRSAIDAAPEPGKRSQFVAQQPLTYKVNDERIEVAHLGDDFALLDVKELPPVKDWKTLIVRDVDGREFTGTKPILLTGLREMRVVTLASGAFEFRVVEPDPNRADGGPAKARIRHKLTNAKSIIIHTKDYEPPAPPSPVAELLIKAGSSEVTLDREAMDAIERDAEPDSREARDTWELISLLKAAKLEPTATLRLTSQAGKTLDLSSEEFQSNASAHFLKRNRRGQFNYRKWSLGENPKRVGEMRGVVSFELL